MAASNKISLKTHNIKTYNPIYMSGDTIHYNVHIIGGSTLELYMYLHVIHHRNIDR